MNEQRLFSVSAPILLCGETGTGKSRLAHYIHSESPWKTKKFLTVHLSSLSENLIESELFGHLKGSFTGAISDKKGYCESVEDGTLFLDEIGELSLEAQKKLLYLLEEKRFTPLGSCLNRPFRGRIIAATNRDLKKLVNDGRFRADLYFRLRVFTYTLPPLKSDPEQIKKLAIKFLDEFSGSTKSISNNALEKLLRYDWPGNVRELKNAIEFASYANTNVLEVRDFPDWLEENVDHNCSTLPLFIDTFPLDYHLAIEKFEKSYFHYVAHHFRGKINHSARELNMSKSTLIAKFRKYGINIWQIRAKQKEEELRVA